jgi:signal transduction histidine kinase
VLIRAPIGADAANIRSVLLSAGMAPEVCATTADLRATLAGECGAVLLTEEALTPELHRMLAASFDAQPAWSDIPVVLIASVGISHTGPMAAARLRGPRRTVTLLERPLRSVTLVATLQTLLAARHRQYEIRDLLHERDLLLSSLETRVAERTAELQRMVQEMEAFSYSVSHDLRSPLRSLAGYANALQEDFGPELPAGARAYLEKIARAAQRMDNLTQDVLAYTRATRCEMEIVAVDLDALIDGVIEQYPAVGSLAGCIRVHRPLGCVRGHVPSLVQCFSNLLGNAVKFMPADRQPEIQVRTARQHGRCRVSIVDNGPGIDPSEHQRIFGMFERVAARQVPGTGIGLAIVKKAVERMGGTVGVISSPGNGAEFWIELAEADAPAAEIPLVRNDASFWDAVVPQPAAVVAEDAP